MNNTIEKWEGLTEYPPKPFTKIQKNGKEVSDIFYDTCLCSHFKNCPYIHEYLDMLDKDDNNDVDDMLS